MKDSYGTYDGSKEEPPYITGDEKDAEIERQRERIAALEASRDRLREAVNKLMPYLWDLYT